MTFKARAAQWLREPLVHFMLIGAVVYAVLALRPPDSGERRIVVDEATVGRLVDRWAQSFRRVPSQAEIDGMISEYVKDEVYYREALRLGLDQDDETIRRLMRNKITALASAEAEGARPTDAQLQALLDKDPARYAGELRFDFEHVYLGNGSTAQAAAPGLLKQLAAGADPAKLGQPVPIPLRFAAATSSNVTAEFGEGFANTLRDLPQGQWQGPVLSGLGLHLVRVTKRTAAAPPKLADIRQRLENDWRAAAIATAEDKYYRGLLEGYDVVTELKR